MLQPPFPNKKTQTSQASRVQVDVKVNRCCLESIGEDGVFPWNLIDTKTNFCWAMEKTWLFRLNKGLYYPIIWEFLEENMGNFWEFWNLDFVFLVPSLCRYSKRIFLILQKTQVCIFNDSSLVTWIDMYQLAKALNLSCHPIPESCTLGWKGSVKDGKSHIWQMASPSKMII